jgi:CrcB protein
VSIPASSPALPTSALVAIGGALGSLARFGVDQAMPPFDAATPSFPWSTFTVNLAGAFLLGLVLAVAEARRDRAVWLQFLVGVGFCGSFTTLSTVSVECVQMLDGPQRGLAAIYLAASFAGGVLTAWLGARLGAATTPPRDRDGARVSANSGPSPKAAP